MPVNAALLAASSANNTAAQAALARARRIECEGFVKNYAHNTATTAEMQHYADCVELLHPQPISSGVIVLIKIFIILGLIGFVAGCVKELKDSLFDGFEKVVMVPLVGLLGAFTVCLVLGIALSVFAGIAFLFS